MTRTPGGGGWRVEPARHQLSRCGSGCANPCVPIQRGETRLEIQCSKVQRLRQVREGLRSPLEVTCYSCKTAWSNGPLVNSDSGSTGTLVYSTGGCFDGEVLLHCYSFLGLDPTRAGRVLPLREPVPGANLSRCPSDVVYIQPHCIRVQHWLHSPPT